MPILFYILPEMISLKKPLCMLIGIIMLITFAACSTRSSQDIVSEKLGVNASAGTELSNSDTHGGFNGDGTSCIVLGFNDDTVLNEIKESSEWKQFPLDETVRALVYGISDETSSIGPFLNDGNGNALVPEIKNGYYLLIDLHTDKETDILSRVSFNFTVGLYDTDTDTLYYCELDT